MGLVLGSLVMFGWMFYFWGFKMQPRQWVNWWAGNQRTPIVRVDDTTGVAVIDNVRHFKWNSRDDFEPSWVKQAYYLDRLDSLDLIIEPLGDSNWFAHTMLSFGFGPELRVVISVEARRELGESFSLIGGLYKQFEIFYQINQERDALTLRALEDDANLYIYPVKASPEFIRELFVDMIMEANRLTDEPQFYHSLRANCTTKLFEHINRQLDEPVSYQREILFPSRAGKLLHEMGRMDTELDYDAAKMRFRSIDRVRRFADDPAFSRKIREGGKTGEVSARETT